MGAPACPAEDRHPAPTKTNHSYIETAAKDFGEKFPHRLRWSHAVNSRKRLRNALENRSHLLEADVASGPLKSLAQHEKIDDVNESSLPLREALLETRGETTVRVEKGTPVIMAHYPTKRSSDLSLECFILAVLKHNETVTTATGSESDESEGTRWSSAFGTFAPATPTPRAPWPRRSPEDADSDLGDATDDEAMALAADLDSELEARANSRRPLIPTCVGPRKRGHDSGLPTRLLQKGVKLDFKRWECVEPTLQYLRSSNAVSKLGGHLWLNADVFAGPGSLVSPLDAQKFVRLCGEILPEAVLSLGWGATQLSTTRRYTHEMIDRMVELCMCPIVKHSLPCQKVAPVPHDKGAVASAASNSAADNSSSEEGFYLPPAAVCRHISFAVAAEYALASADSLRRLLDLVPGASITIYTGVGSLGVTPTTARELVNAYGEKCCFFDLWVTRPWRSWFFGSSTRGAAAPCGTATTNMWQSSMSPVLAPGIPVGGVNGNVIRII